jgi:hypothetical protein
MIPSPRPSCYPATISNKVFSIPGLCADQYVSQRRFATNPKLWRQSISVRKKKYVGTALLSFLLSSLSPFSSVIIFQPPLLVVSITGCELFLLFFLSFTSPSIIFLLRCSLNSRSLLFYNKIPKLVFFISWVLASSCFVIKNSVSFA